MDYEKKYKEALEKARQLCAYPTTKSFISDLQDLFPELADSKEKPNGGIVREDFTQGNGWYKVNLNYLSKAQVEEIEQLVKKWNPKEVSEDEKIKKAILIYLDWLDGKKDYLPKGDYTIKDMILWLEQQAKQDSAWGKEDEHRLKDTIYFLETAKVHYASTVELDACIAWLKSLKGRVQPQPNPEWSEEDKYMYDILCGTIENTDINENTKYKLISWLKSLQDRVGCEANCTTTKEWSEEDEQHIDSLLKRLDALCRNKFERTRFAISEDRDWLKSLRPQNRWKPSDEQMGCLSDAIEHYNSLGYPAPKLKELLDDLKKLKEGKV